MGHGVFEQRAPAILSNFFFMYIAPFFYTLEVLNKSFGYRDAEMNLYDETVEADIAFYRNKRGLKPRKGVNVQITKAE